MFELPRLSYEYDALEPYIDEQTMRLHHTKHHAIYIQKLNEALLGKEEFLSMDIDELVSSIDKVPSEIAAKVRNHGGGHANHSLFWTVMTGKKGSMPTGKTEKAITDVFSDFTNFKNQFKAVAANIFGSGWAWLIVNPSAWGGKLEIISTPNQDSPLMEGKTPVLGLDVWEHAYYLKYQNRRLEYIEAWWNIVNWSEVERRFEETIT